MKQKIEYRLIGFGVFVSIVIIFLTKIDSTPAAYKWIYNLGQYLWFNLAISFLGSVIFYYIVVYLPKQRKQEKFVFQMGMEIQSIYYLGWGFIYNLKNAAGMLDIRDTGKITFQQVEQMSKIVTPQTVHKFENEPGQPTQTFEEYLKKHGEKMDNAISKALTIPYEDIELVSLLLHVQRDGIITGRYSDASRQRFKQLDVTGYYTFLNMLNNYYKHHFEKLIDKQVAAMAKKNKKRNNTKDKS